VRQHAARYGAAPSPKGVVVARIEESRSFDDLPEVMPYYGRLEG
jgi:hypothetical protein